MNYFDDLYLNINQFDLRKLEGIRVKAIEGGFLDYKLRKYVPAELESENNEHVKVNIKLKGSLSDHWRDPVKWSFRVKIDKDQDAIFGMRKFSLQSVERRGFIVDKLYHSILEDMGVVNLQLDYVNLFINGNYTGQYIVEEFFKESILNRLNLPLGPIFKFDYSSYWTAFNWRNLESKPVRKKHEVDNFKNYPVKHYSLSTKDEVAYSENKAKAEDLMNAFTNNKKTTSEVFDINKLGAFFAVNTLFFNQHPAYNTNIRFYYNPSSEKIEPIGYDIERIHEVDLKKETTASENYFPTPNADYFMIRKYFSDSLMTISFHKKLSALINSNIVENNLEKIDPLNQEFKIFFGAKWKGVDKLIRSNLKELKKLNDTLLKFN